MAQSMGVQGVQKTGARLPFGLVAAVVATAAAALLLAPAIRAGNAPATRFAPNPVARVAPAAPTYGDWMTTYGQALAAAKVSGRLAGATAPATTTAPQTGGVNFTDKLRAGRA